MNYQQYSVEDFVLDKSFRKWVLDPDKDTCLFWNNWLDEHPEKAETVARAIELLRQIPVQEDILNAQEILSLSQSIEKGIDHWEKTKKKPAGQNKPIPINAYAASRQKLNTSSPKKYRLKPLIFKVAACILFVLSVLYVVQHQATDEKPQPKIVYEQIVKENPKGQKLTVFLPDGSQVVLNAGSKLSFTKPFHPDRRVVNLEGEAFFEVAKDSLRPFQVISDKLTTTALGTSFNIAAYPTDGHIQVSLTTGKVKVDYQIAEKQQAEAYYLIPGEQLGYDKVQDIFNKQPFDAEKVLAWKEGIIHWENVGEARVVKTLERWYGVQIEVEGESATAWDVTARFNNQSLKSVLTSLSYTMDFVFEIKEEHVLIKYQ